MQVPALKSEELNFSPKSARSCSLPSTVVSNTNIQTNGLAYFWVIPFISVFLNFYILKISGDLARLSRTKPAFVQIDLLYPKNVFVSN